MGKKKDFYAVGVLLTLLGGTLWGFSGSCGQFLFQYKGVTSDWLVPIRLTSAGFLILLGMLIIRKNRIFDVWRESKGRRDILVFAVFGMMLCQYSYFTTIQYSNAGTATVLQYTGPAMILVYTCVKRRKKPEKYELAALCCAMLGTFILATHGKLNSLAIPPRALFWGMLSAVTLVIYTLQPSELMKKYSTMLTLGWGMFLGGIILLVFMRPWMLKPVMDGQTVFLMTVIVLLGTITAFYCYLTGVRLVGASRASMLACVEPVAATVISALWLHVEFGAADLVGFFFVLSTVFIISLNEQKEELHGCNG